MLYSTLQAKIMENGRSALSNSSGLQAAEGHAAHRGRQLLRPCRGVRCSQQRIDLLNVARRRRECALSGIPLPGVHGALLLPQSGHVRLELQCLCSVAQYSK